MTEIAKKLAAEGLAFFGRMNAAISHDMKNVLAIINETASLLDELMELQQDGRIEPNPDKLRTYSSLDSVPLAIAFITFSGFFNAPSSIGRRVIVQRATPPEMRGRVSSAFFVARDILFLLGMFAAGLADYMDVRLLYLISALMLMLAGAAILFMPDLGPSFAEWKRTFALLGGVEAAPRLGVGRPATMSEVERFISPHAGAGWDESQRARAVGV